MITAYEFTLQSTGVLPQDNGYILLSALSRKFPFLHGRREIQIAPVRGTRTPSNKIQLDRSSVLHIRGISEDEAKQISDSWVMVLGMPVCLGTYRVRHLGPSSYLVSKMVVLEDVIDEVIFQASIREMIGQGGSITLGKRRCARVKGQSRLGYVVHLNDLNPETSLRIQALGLGKHTSMGCGVFYAGKQAVG